MEKSLFRVKEDPDGHQGHPKNEQGIKPPYLPEMPWILFLVNRVRRAALVISAPGPNLSVPVRPAEGVEQAPKQESKDQ